MTRRHNGLAVRVAAVTLGVALLAVLVSSLVSVGLVRSAVTTEAHQRLSRDADLVAAFGPRRPASIRARRLLRASGIEVSVVTPAGVVRGGVALTAADAATLRAGGEISGERQAAGHKVVIEGRPLDTGGAIVLAQGAGLSAGAGTKIRNDELAALLAGLAGAALAGLLLARRIAAPLRDVAAGARRLAAGDRDVEVTTAGPAEVSDVGDALNALARALTMSEARQRQFLLSVSHELRTPLTAITGFAEALADGVTTGSDVPASAGVIVNEAKRLDRLVSDLLDLARLDADDLVVDTVDVDLQSLIVEAGEVWSSRCAAVGVTWMLARPELPVVVRTDPLRLRQIIDGLAENALRVTPAGQVIVLSLQASAEHAVIEVRDGGPGLTDEDLPVAFEQSVLYHRYRGVRQVGSGLGLAIVGRLTARIGATATAGHSPEGGARFTITLPVAFA